MRHFAVSAVGRDRPGIVAEVSRVLLEHGANIEDSHMGILRGHFTMMLIVSAPDHVQEALAADLELAGKALELEAIALSPISELDAAAPPSHVLTVYGADHPGIVHAVAEALSEQSVNITDLQTRLLDPVGEGEPVYVLIMEVALPAGVHLGDLERMLKSVGGEQNVEVSVRPLNGDAL